MSWFVYILECRDKKYYTGITYFLKKRVAEHNLGTKSCLHKNQRPVKLAYWERCEDRFEAAKREKQIKRLTHQQKDDLINNLIAKFTYKKIV